MGGRILKGSPPTVNRLVRDFFVRVISAATTEAESCGRDFMNCQDPSCGGQVIEACRAGRQPIACRPSRVIERTRPISSLIQMTAARAFGEAVLPAAGEAKCLMNDRAMTEVTSAGLGRPALQFWAGLLSGPFRAAQPRISLLRLPTGTRSRRVACTTASDLRRGSLWV